MRDRRSRPPLPACTPLDPAAWRSLIARARVLERDAAGPKVWRTEDGRIVKRFRARRRLSSNRTQPRALRFAAHAHALATRGFVSVEVLAIHTVAPERSHVVIYRALEGTSLRTALANAADSEARNALLERFLALMARLHARGVLFRSLQFGNVLCLPDGRLGLIDVADMRLSARPLGLAARLRNFRHLVHHDGDWAILHAFGWPRARERYLAHTALGPLRRRLFTWAWRVWFAPRYTHTHRPVRRGLRKRLRNLLEHLLASPRSLRGARQRPTEPHRAPPPQAQATTRNANGATQ